MNTGIGLSSGEAAARLRHDGPNTLVEQKASPIIVRFFQKLANPLILLLLVAASISAVLGERSDVVIILVITIVSIVLDVYQEAVAVGAADKLRKRVSLSATVIRDGVQKDIPMRDVVVGDVVVVSVGDIVPADAEILTSNDLLVDESMLSGESFPKEVLKNLRMGTNVITGEATATVTAVGSRTELGNISEHLIAPRPETDFERGIAKFSMLLMRTAIIVSVFVFSAHLLVAHNIWSSLLFVLALAIGFALELLPMIVTINLSRGAQRMSRHGVIVKRLASIENFGSMDVLATDKTGTITENRIVLERYDDAHGKKSEKVLQYGYLGSIFQSGFRGPMEEAILSHTEAKQQGYTRLSVLPFDFYRKRVSVLVKKGNEQVFISKGAPEEIIAICRMTPAAKKEALARVDAYGREGLRVLAVAYSTKSTEEKNLTLLGYMAFLDPAKKTAAESLSRLTRHGIAVKILTGDNDVVTEKICRDIGLSVHGVFRGDQLAALLPDAFAKAVEEGTIFARLTPDMKVRVIAALRKNGHVVGYMGDGINDAPSLRAADVGISVDSGADVAKLSADIILLHKDLHVLMEGVHEGRVTFANVLKYLKMNISSDFGNMMSVAIASVFLPFLPMLPAQILLNDLLYDVSQLALASDTVEEKYLRQPRKWDVHAIRKFMLIFGPASSVFDLITFGILIVVFRANPAFFQTGWFLESIVTQTLIIFSIRTQAVPFYRSHPSPAFAASLFGVVVFAMLMPFLPAAAGFSFVRLPIVYFVILTGIVAAYFMLVEGLKNWYYRSTM